MALKTMACIVQQFHHSYLTSHNRYQSFLVGRSIDCQSRKSFPEHSGLCSSSEAVIGLQGGRRTYPGRGSATQVKLFLLQMKLRTCNLSSSFKLGKLQLQADDQRVPHESFSWTHTNYQTSPTKKLSQCKDTFPIQKILLHTSGAIPWICTLLDSSPSLTKIFLLFLLLPTPKLPYFYWNDDIPNMKTEHWHLPQWKSKSPHTKKLPVNRFQWFNIQTKLTRLKSTETQRFSMFSTHFFYWCH